MTPDLIEEFRDRIERRLAELDAEDTLGADGLRTVMLDQQAVGRLSRMDAMQQQAMAQATRARRDAERKRLLGALARVASGDFGRCEDCGEEIPSGRLRLHPGVTRCVSCASGGMPIVG